MKAKLRKKNYRLCCIIASRKLGRIGKLAKGGDFKRLDAALDKLSKAAK